MRTRLGPPTREFEPSEFLLVISIAFGLSIVGSISAALSSDGRPIEFGDAELAFTGLYELFAAAIVAIILRSRGWKWSDFAIHPSRGSTVLGIIVAAAVLALWYAIEVVVGKVPNVASAGLVAVAAISILNPLFEEILVLAYAVQSLRKRFGLTTAVNVSLAIRLAYHLYQGPLAIIPIAAFGLVVTLVYVRLGRLWPVVIAHGILDFVALAGWLD